MTQAAVHVACLVGTAVTVGLEVRNFALLIVVACILKEKVHQLLVFLCFL